MPRRALQLYSASLKRCHTVSSAQVSHMKKVLRNPQITGRAMNDADLNDPDAAKLFAAIGYALTQWNRIEVQLSLIYAQIVGAQEAAMAIAKGHASIISTEARIEVFLASLEWIFSDDDARKTNLSAFMFNLKKAAKLRNEIAHGSVHKLSVSYKKRAGKELFILTPSALPRKHNNGWLHPKYEYDLAELAKVNSYFISFGEALLRRQLEVMGDPSAFFDTNCAPPYPDINGRKYI